MAPNTAAVCRYIFNTMGWCVGYGCTLVIYHVYTVGTNDEIGWLDMGMGRCWYLIVKDIKGGYSSLYRSREVLDCFTAVTKAGQPIGYFVVLEYCRNILERWMPV